MPCHGGDMRHVLAYKAALLKIWGEKNPEKPVLIVDLLLSRLERTMAIYYYIYLEQDVQLV